MASKNSVMAVIRASRPTLRNSHDKIAFVVHASFLAAGYALNATGAPAFSDDALISTYTDEVGIDNWNEFEDNYGFVYSNAEGFSKKVLVKCLAMNEYLFVDAVSDNEGSSPLHLEINVEEYIEENNGTSYSSQYKDLGKLVSSLNKEILNKLSGDLSLEGETRPRSNTNEQLQNYYPARGSVPPLHPTITGPYLYPWPYYSTVYPPRGAYDYGGGMHVGADVYHFIGDLNGAVVVPQGEEAIINFPQGARFIMIAPRGARVHFVNRFARGQWQRWE